MTNRFTGNGHPYGCPQSSLIKGDATHTKKPLSERHFDACDMRVVTPGLHRFRAGLRRSIHALQAPRQLSQTTGVAFSIAILTPVSDTHASPRSSST